MPSWLRNLTATGGAFGASWGGAVWYWRANNRMPSGADLALWLLAAPLALLLAFFGVRALLRRAAARAASPAAAAPAAAAPAASARPVPASLTIVAAALQTPHGAEASEVRAVLAAGTARPALDPELVDDDGYPVLAARIDGADVDADALRDAFLPAAGTRFGEAQWRALALGDAVATELAATLALHPLLDEHAARIDMSTDASANTRTPSPLPPLQLHTFWPDGWSAAQREAGAGWLRQRLAAGGWPLERIALVPDAPEGSDPAAVLRRLHTAAATPGPLLAVLLACGSQLDTATVDAMAAAGTLFTARRQRGQIPGEGACAVLLADTAQAQLLAPGDAALPAVRALATGRLAQSADAATRPDAQPVQALLAQALDDARCTAAQVVLVGADADHRPSRILELMAVLTERLAQLDPVADLVRTGDACGACGPVNWLAALALAADAARERDGAAVCIGNLDPLRRDVAVVAVSDLPPAALQPAISTS